MKTLQITETHGWTIDTLRQQEKQAKQTWQYKRIASVRMVMEGYKGIEVAACLGLNRKSVSEYARLFSEGGLDQLLNRNFTSHKPPYLSQEEQEELIAIISEQTPCELGFAQEWYWNTKLIQTFLMDRFHVGMSREGIRLMMHRLGFRYTRPTYVLIKANEQKQQHFQVELDMIKKT
jgi:transposase